MSAAPSPETRTTQMREATRAPPRRRLNCVRVVMVGAKRSSLFVSNTAPTRIESVWQFSLRQCGKHFAEAISGPYARGAARRFAQMVSGTHTARMARDVACDSVIPAGAEPAVGAALDQLHASGLPSPRKSSVPILITA